MKPLNFPLDLSTVPTDMADVMKEIKKVKTLFVNHLCHLTFRELFALQNGYVLYVILRTPFLKQVLNGFHDFVALYCKNLSLRAATIVLISYI